MDYLDVADVVKWIVMHKWWLIVAVPLVIAILVVRSLSK